MEHHQQPLVLDKTTLKFHRGKGEDTTGGFNTRGGMEAGLRTRLVGSLPGGMGWDGVELTGWLLYPGWSGIG